FPHRQLNSCPDEERPPKTAKSTAKKERKKENGEEKSRQETTLAKFVGKKFSALATGIIA
ncbi:hypothetical protein AVEN_49194-2-1, partial [Araneus ventricosus]